jgi:hypothetical protein
VLKTLFRVILIVVVGGVLLWFLAPRIFNDAANAILSSTGSAVAQAQGLAQYIPPDASTSGKSGDLQVNLSGLTPRTSYEITLDEGQCGTIDKDLGSVTSDGSGNFYIELPLASLDTGQTWFVDVHQDGANGPSVACGQLSTNQNASSQVINASQSGPNVFGPQAPATSSSATGSSGTSTPSLPNTGADPGNNQQYDNNQYPRKY